MRAFGKGIVVMFALIGAIATVQQIRGQGQPAAPLEGGTFTHIGIVVKDINKTAQMFADVYGITPPATRLYDNNGKGLPFPPNIAGNRDARAKTMMIPIGNVRIELWEPVGGPSAWADHLEKYGQSVHHLAFGVTDIEQSLRGLEAKGGKWVMGEPGGTSFKYVDMMDQLGYTVELGRQQPPAAAAPTTPAPAR